MDGKDRSFGSVAALEGVRNPIILARRVQESEHILLVGDGAKRFATLNHIDTDNGEWLIVDRERELWKSLSQKEKVLASEFFLTPHAKGTVGAVAKDKDGNFAAATSTGGTPFKPVGRVGDSPICGSGFFADNSMGACSTTGWGEAIAKILLAYFAVISSDKTNAAELAINKLHSVGGAGGLILLNGKGIPSIHYNTRRMAYCYRDPISGEIVSGP
jgi:beta-aspartyl-peptidase (threonine type)